MYKTKMDKKPAHMFTKISTPFYVNTRLANTNGIKETWRFKTNIGKQSFIARAGYQWNSLPSDIRYTFTMAKFKNKLRNWVKQKFQQ